MIRDLLEELQEHVGLAQAALVREEFASRDSFFHLVLQEGVRFDHYSPRKYQRGYPKLCFQNAYRLVARSRGKLTYVEGYALGSVLAVHHAWCMDADHGIVDTTWDGVVDAKPIDYMGLPFPITAVREVRSREATMIDDWQRGWPLLQRKYEHDGT